MNLKHFLKTTVLFLFIQSSAQFSFGTSLAKDNFQFLEMNIAQLQQGYKDSKFTIKEVVQAYLKRIDKIDKNGPSLHSIIMLNPDAISIAEKMDKEMRQSKKKLSPLFGIPVVIKDNIDTQD